MIRFVVYLAGLFLLALFVLLLVTPVFMACNWLFHRDEYENFRQYREQQGRSGSKRAFAFWYNNRLDGDLYAILGEQEGQGRRRLLSLGPPLVLAIVIYVGILWMLMGPTLAT